MINYEEDAKENQVPPDAALSELRSMVDRMLALDQEVKDRTAALEESSAALRKMQEVTIPERMQELGLASITLEDGQELTLKEDVFASIRKDYTADAYAWLVENGYGDLIKQTVVAVPGDIQSAEVLMQELASSGIDFEQKTTVNANTFKAFVKERLKAGVSLPDTFFSIFDYKKAVIAKKRKR